jgi:hypothetical protein
VLQESTEIADPYFNTDDGRATKATQLRNVDRKVHSAIDVMSDSTFEA